METKHTPGPWVIFGERGNKEKPGIDAINPNYTIIIWGEKDEECGIVGRTEDEQWANAKLIAAAPDLLDACLRALQFIENGIEFGFIRMPDKETNDPATKTPNILREAIKKATI